MIISSPIIATCKDNPASCCHIFHIVFNEHPNYYNLHTFNIKQLSFSCEKNTFHFDEKIESCEIYRKKKKLCKKWGIHLISENTAALIYKCKTMPHLDYIDFVIESGPADRVSKINNIQKKAICRIEYCVEPESRSDLKLLQVKYGIEDLKLRRKRNMAKIIKKGGKKSSIAENKCTNKTNITLRSANKVKLKNYFTSKTNVYNSPFYRGQRLWDALPVDLQKQDNMRSLKND